MSQDPTPGGKPPSKDAATQGVPGLSGILAPGQQVGRYRIEKLLGLGSMGEVFLAIDDQLGRNTALKTLGSKHLNNATVKERFLREARALARLTHPNLITVFEAGMIAGTDRPYFAMELLEGGDCQRLLDERGPLDSGVVATIGAQAAAALSEAAKAGIIHRDVKPANLGISGRGAVKVTDFSLAKSVAADKSLTGKGMVVGTADYIAPEQARGEEVDERADVYSLGCTLFHLLTGKPPFRCKQGTEVQKYVEVMRAHLTAPIPDPREFVAGVDEDLRVFIERMMDKNMERRPSLDEAAIALAQTAVRLEGDLPRVTRAAIRSATADNTIVALAHLGERTQPPHTPPVLVAPHSSRHSTKRLLAFVGLGLIVGAALAVVASFFVLR
ncbi:MAG: serine/threonine-protein kinase [Deltaproteobacteria bacterium]|nr:serine/threonine-protein kinase [Deltaproteobacteria bacterium]